MFTLSKTSIRNTILYRTLLHELGHWVQYERDLLNDETALFEDADVACDLYFAQPKIEHENFAHHYASELNELLRTKGVIPFEQLD